MVIEVLKPGDVEIIKVVATHLLRQFLGFMQLVDRLLEVVIFSRVQQLLWTEKAI